MLATLMVVTLLGVLATIALTAHFGSSPPGSGTSLPPAQTTTVPQNVASAANAAAKSACEADYALLLSAVANYRALNGSSPPAGQTWATSTAHGGPFVQSWPSETHYFALSWNGSIVTVVPVKGRASHGSLGVARPASGCYAL
jgi:hypothetical protein